MLGVAARPGACQIPALSDHYDGTHFFNPGDAPRRRGFGALLRWRLSHRREPWPDWVTDPAYPPPPTQVDPASVAVTFIGHASFLLRFADCVVLTDPVFSARCSPVGWAGPKRHRAPGLSLAALPRPDVVLLSHNHYDHMDFPTLRVLRQRFAPRFVTTAGNAATLRRAGIAAAAELDWWEALTLPGLVVTATPARHFSARTLRDRNATLWGGFMLRTPAGQVLFAGDSGAGDHGAGDSGAGNFGAGGHWAEIRARLGAPGLALLPIGAYEPRWFMAPVHMNPAEAVEAHRALGARRSIGMHFGTFRLTDEAIDAPVAALAVARQAAGIGVAEFDVLGCGETRVIAL